MFSICVWSFDEGCSFELISDLIMNVKIKQHLILGWKIYLYEYYVLLVTSVKEN